VNATFATKAFVQLLKYDDTAPIVGALGTLNVVLAAETALGFPVPTEFFACTINVYDVPLAKPVTVIGEIVPLA
jgi:hypothetical protein